MSIIHVASVSSGIDSQATLEQAVERFGAHRVIAIFCDTDNEDQAVYDHLDYLEREIGVRIHRLKADFTQQIADKRWFVARDVRTGREYDTKPVFKADGKTPVWKRDGFGNIVMKKGKPVQKTVKVGGGRRRRWSNKAKRRALSVLYPTGNAFLDLCIWKGRFPSRKAQFCTEELKRNMAVDFQLGLIEKGHTVVSWQGVRRDESEARKNAPKFESLGGGMFIYRPIVDWTKPEAFAYCAARGRAPCRCIWKVATVSAACPASIRRRKRSARRACAVAAIWCASATGNASSRWPASGATARSSTRSITRPTNAPRAFSRATRSGRLSGGLKPRAEASNSHC